MAGARWEEQRGLFRKVHNSAQKEAAEERFARRGVRNEASGKRLSQALRYGKKKSPGTSKGGGDYGGGGGPLGLQNVPITYGDSE